MKNLRKTYAKLMTIAAGDFHRFMDDKVAGVRASTDRAPPPQYTTAP